MTKRRLKARIERWQAELDALEADEPVEEGDEADQSIRDEYENRVVVKFFWKQLSSPMESDEWKGRDGMISVIRRRMGKGAPTARTVERTLQRLVEDENDDLSSKRGVGCGAARAFSDEDDMYVGLLICEGHSQRSATFLINGERAAQGLPPVDRQVIRDAEARCEIIRRRRGKKKSGSADLESAWCRASLAFTLQVQLQLRAGAELARRPVVGPVFKLTWPKSNQQCLPTDEWGVLGWKIHVRFPGQGWWWCSLIGYTGAGYVIESVSKEWGTTRHLLSTEEAWKWLSQKQRSDVEAAKEVCANAPPPFVPEQLLVVDQHHRKTRLGKTSQFDCKMPVDEDGNWCSTDDGGEYPVWSDNTSTKYASDVRLHFGVMMARDAAGTLHGYRMEPFEYTGKWVVGVKRIEQEVKAVVDKANRLKGGGAWACTAHYSAPELAALEGGRWEAWFKEKHGSGDGWRDAVLEKVGSGDHALICVTELMQHTIDEGDRLFADTPYKDTWMINCDRLASWWEKEAQEYLDERGFKDQQVRAWGDTNSEFWRYHESVPGDRPEFCAMDFHLFNDLDHSTDQNIINTSSLPLADESELDEGDLGLGLRYDDGTPRQLSWAMRRTWLHNPSSERIVEDISRYPTVIDRIVEHKGGVVPDHKLRAGCSQRKRKLTEPSRCYVMSPQVATVAKDRSKQLRETAKKMCGNA